MNEEREYHSQCALGDCLYVFFGCNDDNDLNTIESLNAKNVINGVPESWLLIQLGSDIQPRRLTLASQIDENEIAILGGEDQNGRALDDILRYDHTTDLWVATGRMSEPKKLHAVTRIANVSTVCT